ncbi:family 43 glycosylhydrolase [Gracilibacillus sp. YIM 98692]|uniref:family 43 glycosylhydrolase n=1 Tax=Gracilibacillus sp. YIM 98692 TaxID=2663532 RepID=UPI0013D506D3|nr:family 43 glycosylhydrolase [Gracilibacillus sp. YIM 98692]
MRTWIINLFIISSFFLLLGCSEQERTTEETFQNPVYEPVLADPSIIRADDGYFYAYGTEDAWDDVSKPVLIPIVRSKDLVDWEYVGPAFEEKPTWKGAGSLWAPDIQKVGDTYYLYYSLSIWGDANPGIGVATSESPTGPFEDKGKLFTSEEIGVQNSIDPFYYQTENESSYLFWGSFHGIYGVRLTDDGLAVDGEKFQIAGNAFEAPYIIKRDGYYYFFGSTGSCCDGENSTYQVTVGRAEQLEGPYVDKEGNDLRNSSGTVILSKQNDGAIVGPGHNAIITDDHGDDWIVYHGIHREDPTLWTGATRRPLFIDRFKWEDGWPYVEGNQPNTAEQQAPIIE